jgi:hypothetical protein
MDAAVPTLRHLTYLRCQDNESLFALLLFLRELLILEMVHAHLESASASNPWKGNVREGHDRRIQRRWQLRRERSHGSWEWEPNTTQINTREII